MQEFQWTLSELDIETVGLCQSRPLPFSDDQRAPDVAYDLSSTSAVINTTVDSLFPNGIPEEFVLFATVKVANDNTADLFTIIDGEQSLSFSLNPVEFEYRRRGKAPVRAGISKTLADGAWHRVALAVRKKHVTLSLDCARRKEHGRKPRGFRPSFGRDSVVRLEEQFKVRAARVTRYQLEKKKRFILSYYSMQICKSNSLPSTLFNLRKSTETNKLRRASILNEEETRHFK